MFNMVEIMKNILSFLFVYFFFSFFPPLCPPSLFSFLFGVLIQRTVWRGRWLPILMAVHRRSRKKCGLCDANYSKLLAQFVSV